MNLPKLEKLVLEVKEDLQNYYKIVPFEISGNYLQCMPKPGSPFNYIVVNSSIQNSMNKTKN